MEFGLHGDLALCLVRSMEEHCITTRASSGGSCSLHDGESGKQARKKLKAWGSG